MNELQQFLDRWTAVARGTVALMRALPEDQYDFRPDPGGRSIGELAWHLAEADAYTSYGITRRSFDFTEKPPHIQRPRQVQELAPAYELVHQEAVARIRELQLSDLDIEIKYADDTMVTVRDLLWDRLLVHAIHHRGQLVVLCRLAGGVPPGIAGKSREEMAAFRERKAVAV